MRLIDADELITAFPCGETVRTECVRATIKHMPTIEERKKGKWVDRKVIDDRQDAKIQQWQTCKCSICERYDTRPYLYYFSEPRFCSWCGADMRGEQE